MAKDTQGFSNSEAEGEEDSTSNKRDPSYQSAASEAPSRDSRADSADNAADAGSSVEEWRSSAAAAVESMTPEERSAQAANTVGTPPIGEYVERDPAREADDYVERDPARGVHNQVERDDALGGEIAGAPQAGAEANQPDAASLSSADGESLSGSEVRREVNNAYARQVTDVVEALPEGEGPLARLTKPEMAQAMTESAMDIHGRIEEAHPDVNIDSSAVVGTLRANLGAYEDGAPDAGAIADELGDSLESPFHNAMRAEERQAASAAAFEAGPSNAAQQEAQQQEASVSDHFFDEPDSSSSMKSLNGQEVRGEIAKSYAERVNTAIQELPDDHPALEHTSRDGLYETALSDSYGVHSGIQNGYPDANINPDEVVAAVIDHHNELSQEALAAEQPAFDGLIEHYGERFSTQNHEVTAGGNAHEAGPSNAVEAQQPQMQQAQEQVGQQPDAGASSSAQQLDERGRSSDRGR
jgi:hypothetical protein